MLTAPSRDRSVFQQIFADHWEAFQHAHPRYQTPYYNGLVAKMLACGHPEKIGYIEYRCLHCGQGKHLVAMSCKSSLCLRCAKVHVDNWVSQVRQVLHEGIIYRHIILTVPAMFMCPGTSLKNNLTERALQLATRQRKNAHRKHTSNTTPAAIGT